MQALSTENYIYVARQPIFDLRMKVCAYELLYRSLASDKCASEDGDQATFQVIHNVMNMMGLTSVSTDRKVFINFTRKLLVDQIYTVLDPDKVVIEVLENIVADDEVVQACRQLKDLGYTLALDDYALQPGLEPLIDLADIIKIDFPLTTPQDRREIARLAHARGIELLAEKIETSEQVDQAKAIGCIYLQGYFFCHPQLLIDREISGSKQNYMMLLAKAGEPNIDFDDLANLIRRDASISIKLLRYINSAGLGVKHKVKSIKDAMLLLGQRPLLKWVSIVAMTCIASDKPTELMVTALLRGRFCELAATAGGISESANELFLVGLLSTLDAMVDKPLEQILDGLPVSTVIRETLLGDPTPLSPVLNLALAVETADWEQMARLAKEQLNLESHQFHEAYTEAINWVDQVMDAV